MKRTNEEIFGNIVEIMLSNNFNQDDVNYFTKDAEFEHDIVPEFYRKWLFRQERYYSNHYRLGNNIFTICKKRGKRLYTGYAYSNIYDAYERPSIYKIRIWEKWEEDLKDFSISMYITSWNTFQFSIAGELVLPTTGEVVPYYITKTRQEIYL